MEQQGVYTPRATFPQLPWRRVKVSLFAEIPRSVTLIPPVSRLAEPEVHPDGARLQASDLGLVEVPRQARESLVSSLACFHPF